MINKLSQIMTWCKRHVKILTMLLFVAFVGWYASCHSIIAVNIERPELLKQRDLSITLTSENGKKSTFSTKADSVRRVVRSGRTEIQSEGTGYSSWTSVKLLGFLKYKRVYITPEPELKREFIGNNPASCALATKNILVSYDCGGDPNSLKIHTAASLTLPSYVIPVKDVPLGTIEGVFEQPTGVEVLALIGEEDDSVQVIYNLDVNTGQLTQKSLLSKLPADKTYSVKNYSSGYLLYDSSYSSLFYYTNGEVLSIDLPKNVAANLNPIFVNSSFETIVEGYSDVSIDDFADAPDKSAITKVASNTIFITPKGEKTKQLSPKFLMGPAMMCGANRLCVMDVDHTDSNRLHVYDTASSDITELYTMNNIKELRVNQDDFVVLIKDNAIWSFDAEKVSAHKVYDLGDYSLCGLGGDLPKNLVCVQQKNQASMLRLGQGNDTSIDKLTSELSKKPDIVSVRVYKNIIFVLPAINKVQTDAGFIDDPEQAKQMDETIKSYVSELKIDTKIYTVVNMAAP